MKVPFVNFGESYRQHKKEYDEAINKCLEEGQLILREEVEEFEENLASFLGMKYAVGVNSGTDALHLALKAKLGTKRPLIATSGYTFKATMEAISRVGQVHIYDTEDRLMKPEDGYTIPTIPVHIEGMISKDDNAIIEDACQAIGAEGVGYSDTACYSFYPAKILGGIGDGGAVVTNDKDVYEKVKLYRHHWQTDEDEEFGYCSRLDNIQAAYLNVKLKYLPEILERRDEIAEKYKKLSLVAEVEIPIYQKGRVWQDYVIRVQEPQKLAHFLKSEGIETLGVGMTPPHKAFGFDYTLKNTEQLYKEMLRLPCNETLTDEEVDYVIQKVYEYYR